MDNILDKFGLYDFFGLLIPGMVFIFALIFMDFPLLSLGRYPQSSGLLVTGFILLSYVCGVWMQEIGSFTDKKLWKIDESAKTRYITYSEVSFRHGLYEKIYQKCSKTKWKGIFLRIEGWLKIDISFEGEESKRVKKMIEDISNNKEDSFSISEEKRCKNIFFICKAYLENNNKIEKAERLNAMYAMGRDFVVCNIGIMVCTILTMLLKWKIEVRYLIIIGYALLSSFMFYRRAKRFAVMRVKTIIRQYMDLKGY